MANLVNLKEFDNVFQASVASVATARAHMKLTETYMSERPLISQVNLNRTTAEMRKAIDKLNDAMTQFQYAVSNLVHQNRDGRG